MTSIRPSTELKLSIQTIVTLIVGVISITFGVGVFYATVPNRVQQDKQTEKMQKIEVTLEKSIIILDRIEKRSDSNSISISDMKDKQHTINNEVQLLSSDVKQIKEKVR